MASRYIIGIDLGTTNSAVSFLDTAADPALPQILALPQVTDAGEVDRRDALPSFIYLPDAGETAAGALDLPWASKRDYAVGTWARKNASTLPGKTVSSAKSWLCSDNVDRLSPILPFNRNLPERQISPVTAAQRFLEHVRDAWDQQFGADGECLADQEVILTVPASFDAVARELTVKAATAAGLDVTLLEEPQAAFYSWLQGMDRNWRDQVQAGDKVIVCDIGGGTTDFSLIEVMDEGGDLALRRIAVGDHILLGGDNMDLTLAYTLAEKLRSGQGVELDPWQITGLTHACREAKETLLSDPQAGPQKLSVLGRGSSVIGGAISTELNFDELESILLDGFFPICAVHDAPAVRTQTALRTFGLNYAQDPAVTRHLAAFLLKHCAESELPNAILFNGGVTKAPVLRDRIVTTLNSWIDGGDMKVLAGTQPDLAVALGSCWYGNVRRGNAIRIKAGSPHTYYVGIESSMPAVPGFAPPLQALCVVPFGLEEGSERDVHYAGLGLVVGTTTEFRFFAATDRPDDELACILPNTRALTELPALGAELDADADDTPPGTLVPITLKSILTEIGTLQIWCQETNGKRSWRLEYEVRGLE